MIESLFNKSENYLTEVKLAFSLLYKKRKAFKSFGGITREQFCSKSYKNRFEMFLNLSRRCTICNHAKQFRLQEAIKLGY